MADVGYSKKVMDHFMNPKNVGTIEDADGYGKVGNPVCGDLMEIFIKVKKDVIDDIKFRTFGCGSAIATSSMVTELAKGKNVDFVSRFFAPRYGINEDPVTGSAHCALTSYWAGKLNKTKLSAKQVSKRTGYIECELKGDRVFLSGKAIKYMAGKINF